MATRDLARWTTTLAYEDLPASVLKAAVRSFQNALGCIIGGSSHPTVQRVLRATERTAKGPCTCLGQRASIEIEDDKFTTDLNTAVLINGIASHVHDYDDTHLSTVIHPAGAIVVSLLAYAEYLRSTTQRLTTGKEFITALVVGIETSLRLGNAISPNHYSAGWHITGTVSPLGVAAAISNLLHLDVDMAVAALGIASTQPVGIRVHFGTDTKSFHVGRAAQVGIEAVHSAQVGLTAAPDALEGKRGWVEILGHGSNNLEEQIGELLDLTQRSRDSNASVQPSTSQRQQQQPWEIEKNTFKPFPCGIVIHPTIDASIQLHDKHDLYTTSTPNIKSVHLKVHPLVLDLTGKRTPQDSLQAKFSVYHGCAIGLLFGSGTPAEYEDHIVRDERVIQLRDKVVAEADKSVRSDEAYVKVLFEDGREVECHVEHTVGSLERPMSDEELGGKFLRQAGEVTGAKRADEVERLAWQVCELEDVCEIVRLAR